MRAKQRIAVISDYFVRYYENAGRTYAWRYHRTPYRVYVSEMLLQRTRAEQVEPVFQKLVSLYKSVGELYAGFNEAIPYMLTLGRMCRLKYFKSGLEYLVTHHHGEIPAERKELLAVPGTGDYIAAAIRIFGFGVSDVIIDANVVRVLSRLYGFKANAETRRRKWFGELAGEHVPAERFVEYSYGILDFAAQICRPVHPRCGICGLRELCAFCVSVII